MIWYSCSGCWVGVGHMYVCEGTVWALCAIISVNEYETSPITHTGNVFLFFYCLVFVNKAPQTRGGKKHYILRVRYYRTETEQSRPGQQKAKFDACSAALFSSSPKLDEKN